MTFDIPEGIGFHASRPYEAGSNPDTADTEGTLNRLEKYALEETSSARQESQGPLEERIVENTELHRHIQVPAKASFHILVADDNRVSQRLFAKILEKHHYVATVVDNGQAALDAIQEKRYDAVLMDVQMPIMGGLEATAKIREYERRLGIRRTPIVAVTGHRMPGDREECINAQLDEYISKPVMQSKLISAIEKYTRLGGVAVGFDRVLVRSYVVEIREVPEEPLVLEDLHVLVMNSPNSSIDNVIVSIIAICRRNVDEYIIGHVRRKIKALRESRKVETSDNTEVVGACHESKPEVTVRVRGGINNLARAKNHLIAIDAVASEAISSTQVVEAASTSNIRCVDGFEDEAGYYVALMAGAVFDWEETYAELRR
ncbi:hypothetical protein DL767_000439 [Monosporascus sp. MG133]|nr:hypothetical protein DL767_000439 [Monosporascus sp. MG133]